MTEAVGLEGYRLSPQQRRLWRFLGTSGDVGGRPFRSRCLLRIPGYSAATLDAALARVVEAHEILRSTYEKLPEMALPVQVPQPVTRFRVEDAGTASAAELWARTAGSDGILTAVRAESGAHEHLLLLELPALSADARTWTALAAEIARAVEAGDAYEPEALPYAQFAEWQNGLLEDEDAAEGRAWWETRKLSAIEPLRWPFLADSVLGRAAGASFRLGRMETSLPAETAASLFAAAERLGVSPEVFALAAWQILLARFTGRRELVSGWLDAGRGHEALEDALGLFARVQPIPSDLQPGLPFAEVVRQIGSWIEESSEHAEHFRPDSHFAAGFAWEERNGVERLETVTERFDLLLTGIRDSNSLTLAVVHDESRVSGPDASRVGQLFTTLLAHASQAPETPLDDLDLLTAAEHRELLAAGDGGTVPFPEDATLHGLFAAQAARTPDRTAVEAGGESLTYAELASRARRLARHLRGLGVGPDVPVGILLERSVDWMISVWGVLEAGGACLPLDPSHPAERLAGILQETRVPAVVTREALVEEAVDGIAWVFLDRHAGEIARHADDHLEHHTLPGNLAYVISTSGTSGRPKGVMVTHRSAVHLAAALEHAIYQQRPEGLRVSVNAPLTFDASVKQWIQLLAGRTLVIAPEEARPDSDRLAAWVREARVDVLDCTPSQLRGLLDAGLGQLGDRPGDAVPAAVLVGGEAIDPDLWTRLADLETRVYNVYGPTECTVDVTVRAVAGPRPVLGKPLPNVRAHVLDAALRPVPFWVAGELYVGGAGVARGYLARPDLTAERFVPDPFSSQPGERLYRTGDRVRLLPLQDGGDLEFLGRLDHQVKIRGFRIELEEIEAVLAGHPDVRRAAAAVRETPAGPQLAAWAALRTGARPESPAEDFRGWLRRRLPEFMVPAVVAVLPDLPLTRHGKVDRAALPDPGDIQSSRPAYVEPRSEAERTVAGVWADVLGVESVGVADNFFDLGGHSLLMVRAHGRLQEAFGRPISMVDLFRYPTVEALAGHLTREPGEQQPDAVSLDAVRDRAERQREEQERQRQAMQRARRLR